MINGELKMFTNKSIETADKLIRANEVFWPVPILPS